MVVSSCDSTIANFSNFTLDEGRATTTPCLTSFVSQEISVRPHGESGQTTSCQDAVSHSLALRSPSDARPGIIRLWKLEDIYQKFP